MGDLERPLRVIVGEDDVLMREGIVRLLAEAGLNVVAQAGDADDLLGKTLAYRPDIVVVDVQMPPNREDDGLIAAMELRRRQPALGVLVLSQFNEESYALDLIGDNPESVGYLLKERVGDVDTFISAIKRVAAGGTALDAAVVRRMLGRDRRDDPLRVLSARVNGPCSRRWPRASRTSVLLRPWPSVKRQWKSTLPPSSASSTSVSRAPNTAGSRRC